MLGRKRRSRSSATNRQTDCAAGSRESRTHVIVAVARLRQSSSEASLPNRAPALRSRVSSHSKDCLPQGERGSPTGGRDKIYGGCEVRPRLRMHSSCITLTPLFGTGGSLSARSEYLDKFGKIIFSVGSFFATVMLHTTCAQPTINT